MNQTLVDELIQSLYASLVSKTGFSNFLSTLVKQLSLLSGAVVMINEQNQRANLIWVEGLDIEDATQFVESNVNIDPLMSQLQFSQAGKLIIMGDSDAKKMLEQHPDFFENLNKDLDIYYAIGTVLSNDGTWSSQLFFHRSKNQGPFSEQECQLLEKLVPHIQHAMQLFHLKQNDDKKLVLAEMLFNQIQVPVVLVDEEGVVCHANQQANLLFEKSKQIKKINNTLHLRCVKSKNKLQQAILQCLDTRNVEVFSLEQQKITSYTFTVVPLIHSSMQSQVSAAVFIYNSQHAINIDLTILCALFELTEKEGLICQELVHGHSPSDIAQMHYLSYETVRTYIKRAMKKTNTTRQNELVAKLISSPAYTCLKPLYLH